MNRTHLGLALLFVTGAQAATLYTLPAPTVEFASPGSMPATFSAGAGAGNVTFELQGYASLDGDNSYIDIFHLSVNGLDVFSGTWDLGGGGSNRILVQPSGATATLSAANRTVNVSVPVTFINGSNTVTFAYDSPTTF
jgi:hypothetical protein